MPGIVQQRLLTPRVAKWCGHVATCAGIVLLILAFRPQNLVWLYLAAGLIYGGSAPFIPASFHKAGTQ